MTMSLPAPARTGAGVGRVYTCFFPGLLLFIFPGFSVGAGGMHILDLFLSHFFFSFLGEHPARMHGCCMYVSPGGQKSFTLLDRDASRMRWNVYRLFFPGHSPRRPYSTHNEPREHHYTCVTPASALRN